jgi:putative transposase
VSRAHPFHDRTITVTPLRAHLLRWTQGQHERRLRRAERRVKEISEKIWLLSFMQYDLGFFDHESEGA